MEDEQGSAFLSACSRYRRTGWISLAIGILCRAFGYGLASPGAFPFADGLHGMFERIWVPMTLLEVGLVLLILGPGVVAISLFCELLALGRRP